MPEPITIYQNYNRFPSLTEEEQQQSRDRFGDAGAGPFIRSAAAYRAEGVKNEERAAARRAKAHDTPMGRTKMALERLGREQADYRGLARRFEDESGNVNPELRRTRATASAAVAQRLKGAGGGADQAGTLEQALRGAKARQGIIQRGEPAIKSQALKDRLSMARLGISTQGRGLAQESAGERIRYGAELATEQADHDISAARWAALGSLTGVASGWQGNMSQPAMPAAEGGFSADQFQMPWQQQMNNPAISTFGGGGGMVPPSN